jgi:uncharacterized membrane protein YeaQ/YmgE (transglycosylase-associated protein family)
VSVTLGTIVVWLLIGLIAGWLAGEIMSGHGFGLVGNVIVGIVGAAVGGLVLSALGIDPGGFVGDVVQALIGALVFLFIVGLIRRA